MRLFTFNSLRVRFNLNLLKSPSTLGFSRTTVGPQVLVEPVPDYLSTTCKLAMEPMFRLLRDSKHLIKERGKI